MTRILVVDDSPLEAAVAVRVLRENPNWEVDHVRSVQDAFAYLASQSSRLILTDLDLRGATDLTLKQAGREHSPWLTTIAMSSCVSKRTVAEALGAGVAGYLPKSCLETNLAALCERALAFADPEKAHANLINPGFAKRFEIIIANERKHLPPLIEFIVDQCVRFGVCGKDHYVRLGVAVEEAVLNAMIHGNLEVTSELREESDDRFEQTILERLQQRPYCERHVHIVVTLTPQECRITVRDEGPGFNLQDLRDPTDPANLSRVSGRGILLMRSFVDEVRYNDRGNEVLQVIRRCPTPVGAVEEVGASAMVSSAG